MKKKEKKRSRVCSGLDIHIAATSNGSGVQFRSRLDSRRFENLTVPSEIEG